MGFSIFALGLGYTLLLYRTFQIGLNYAIEPLQVYWNKPVNVSPWVLKVFFFNTRLEKVPLLACIYQFGISLPIALAAPVVIYAMAALAKIVAISRDHFIVILWMMGVIALYFALGFLVFEALKKFKEYWSGNILKVKAIFPWKLLVVLIVFSSLFLLALGFHESPILLLGWVAFVLLYFGLTVGQSYRIDENSFILQTSHKVPFDSIQRISTYPKAFMLMRFQAVRIHCYDGKSYETRPVNHHALIEALLARNPDIQSLDLPEQHS